MSEHTKRQVLVVGIVTSLLPSMLVLRFPEMISPMSVALWGSAVLGYTGIVLLLWMYMLGAKSVMGIVFKDLAPVLSIHKWLGKYGTLLIFLHPLLVTYSYGESVLFSVIPQVGSVAQRHILFGSDCFLATRRRVVYLSVNPEQTHLAHVAVPALASICQYPICVAAHS